MGTIVSSGFVNSGNSATAGAGSNRIFVIACHTKAGGGGTGDATVTEISWGGGSATLSGGQFIPVVTAQSVSAVRQTCDMFYVKEADIPAGSSLSITWSTGVIVSNRASHITLAGMHQTEAPVTDTAVTDSAASVSGSVDLSADDIVVAAVTTNYDVSNTGITWTGPTEYQDNGASTAWRAGLAAKVSTGATETCSPAVSVATEQAMAIGGFRDVNYAGTTVTGTLGNKYAALQTSLSGLSWAWFDENVGALAAPTAQGAVAVTDGSGAITLDATGTALTAGQTGTLVIYDSTGEKFGAYRAILGDNGKLRFDSPVSGSSFFLDDQATYIGDVISIATGPLR